MAKPRKAKFVIRGVDQMRADLGVTANRLAGASGCSLAVTQAVLLETPRTKAVCERIINGLKVLGHKTASHLDISPVEQDD